MNTQGKDLYGFESRQPHLCNSMWGHVRLLAGRQEVGKCNTSGRSQVMYITFASAKIEEGRTHFGFEPQRRTSPEIQNRGTSGPKKGHVCPPKTYKKERFVWVTRS